MNNIVSVAENAKKIASGPPVVCECGDTWYSIFDKLYVSAYNECKSCSDTSDLMDRSVNINEIINAIL